MNALKKKLGKTGGFTLIEMLIVVAIIAILIAISIPLVSSVLERARDATDQANERSAKAEAILWYMGLAVDSTGNELKFEDGKTYYYDAGEGAIKEVTTGTTPTGYGKCTLAVDSHTGTKPVFLYSSDITGGHQKGYLQFVSITADGVVTFKWVAGA